MVLELGNVGNPHGGELCMIIMFLFGLGVGICVGIAICILIGLQVEKMQFPKTMISEVLTKLTEEELKKQGL